MPIFEYACSECGHRFEALVLFSTTGKKDVACPDCGSVTLSKMLSVFAPSTGSQASAPPLCETTGGCATPNLPGCAKGMCGLS